MEIGAKYYMIDPLPCDEMKRIGKKPQPIYQGTFVYCMGITDCYWFLVQPCVFNGDFSEDPYFFYWRCDPETWDRLKKMEVPQKSFYSHADICKDILSHPNELLRFGTFQDITEGISASYFLFRIQLDEFQNVLTELIPLQRNEDGTLIYYLSFIDSEFESLLEGCTTLYCLEDDLKNITDIVFSEEEQCATYLVTRDEEIALP